MRLRVAGRSDAESKMLLDVADQVCGMGEASVNGGEATLVRGRIASERDQVLDTFVLKSREYVVYGVACLS